MNGSMTKVGRLFPGKGARKGGAFAIFTLLSFLLCPTSWAAADMPVAAGSPIAGIVFDDQPLILPVQRNFQMAMLTVSSELGRSCGRMEAYGWRVDGDEQQRVNQIFNNTIDRIRAQGFVVESKKTNAVSRDVTLFTANNQDKNLIFLWSAGDIGLVMVLCEASAPLVPTPQLTGAEKAAPSLQPANLPAPFEVERERRAAARLAAPAERRPQQLTRTGKPKDEAFSPIGNWTGSYTCSQGTMGATLTVSSLKGNRFEGVMRFYPTTKNPYVPSGSYAVFGEYDADSLRILVNPGAWIDRPKDYYSTIMIGSFDPVDESFSAFFQGITGCTSYEARLERDADGTKTSPSSHEKDKKKTQPIAKKPVVTKKTSLSKAQTPKKAAASSEPPPSLGTAMEKPRDSAIEKPSVGIDLNEATDILAP